MTRKTTPQPDALLRDGETTATVGAWVEHYVDGDYGRIIEIGQQTIGRNARTVVTVDWHADGPQEHFADELSPYTPAITSVWSAYGHEFMDDGDGTSSSCLTCGASYALVPNADDPTSGTYQASNGDEPKACTRNTSMHHGDPGETGHSLECTRGCEDCRHDCNCLQCA